MIHACTPTRIRPGLSVSTYLRSVCLSVVHRRHSLCLPSCRPRLQYSYSRALCVVGGAVVLLNSIISLPQVGSFAVAVGLWRHYDSVHIRVGRTGFKRFILSRVRPHISDGQIHRLRTPNCIAGAS